MPTTNVKVRLDADGSRFNSVMNSAMGKVGSFGKSVASTMGGMMLANFGTSAIKSAVDSTIKLAGTLSDLRKELGVTEQDLYALRKASGDAQGGIDQVANAFRAFGIARRQALSGDAKKMSLFQSLGISQDELKNLQGIKLSERIAQGLEGKSVSGKAQLMTQLTNKKVAASFVPMQSALTNFGDYKAGLDKAGMLPKQESFNKLDALDATLDDLKTVIEAGLISVLGELISALASWTESTMNWFERYVAGKGAEALYAYDESVANKKRYPMAEAVIRLVLSGPLMKPLNNLHSDTAGKPRDPGYVAADIAIEKVRKKQEQRKIDREQLLEKRRQDRENAIKGGNDFISPELEEKTVKGFLAKQREMQGGSGGVAVGNFLGSSVNILQQLATETNDYLSQIRDFTKQMAEKQATTTNYENPDFTE